MGEITFENVTFGYGRRDILKEMNVQFDSSEITLLTGGTGCGKSTLLYLAAGIYPENAGTLRSGSITVNGGNPALLSPVVRCRKVGMMFQNPSLQFCMDTVEHELAFCLENIQASQAVMEASMDAALDFCNIGHLRKRTLISLSGGEKQLAMLACMVLLSPEWILLDEPFANLDDGTAGVIVQKLSLMHKKLGTGILAVDHRLENWLCIAEEIKVMDETGALVAEGIRQQEELTVLEKWDVHVPGYAYQEERPEKTWQDICGEPILELQGLSVSYEDTWVLKGIDADFYPGYMYAVTGASGSGKTSLFDALRGLVRYDGNIRCRGQLLKRRFFSAEPKIGFVVQNPQDQFVGDTVYDEVFLSLKHRRDGLDPDQETERILREICLWKYRRVSPYKLSQGQQRRLGVAALLAYDCDLLICDEPTYAQDRSNTISIMENLQKAVKTRGTTVIFSTHDMQLTRDYSDMQYIMEGGRLYEVDKSRL